MVDELIIPKIQTAANETEKTVQSSETTKVKHETKKASIMKEKTRAEEVKNGLFYLKVLPNKRRGKITQMKNLIMIYMRKIQLGSLHIVQLGGRWHSKITSKNAIQIDADGGLRRTKQTIIRKHI